ncbi:sugar ABC transporter ATP-binding protein, partial [Rhizobium johnstonii]
EKISLTSPVAGLAHGIAYSTENRRDDGIVADLSVRENIMLAVQARRGWLRRVPAREVDRLVTTYMEKFSVRPNDPDRPIRLLSGGNQQKVLLGRW